MSRSDARALEIIAHEAAGFISREAGPDSLITVTRARSVGDHVAVFISVFPEDKIRPALAFLERQRQAFSDHLKSHTNIRVPRVDFLIENNEEMGETPKTL